MSEFTLITIVTLLLFYPVFAHFGFEFSFVNDCFLTSCVVFFFNKTDRFFLFTCNEDIVHLVI